MRGDNSRFRSTYLLETVQPPCQGKPWSTFLDMVQPPAQGKPWSTFLETVQPPCQGKPWSTLLRTRVMVVNCMLMVLWVEKSVN